MLDLLPCELRSIVLQYCLVVEDSLQPYRKSYHDFSERVKRPESIPVVALLRVNRTISEEAARILYGKNTWHVTATTILAKRGAPLFVHARFLFESLWARHAKLFRHVIVGFGCDDIYHGFFLYIDKDIYLGRDIVTSEPSINDSNKEHLIAYQQMQDSRAFKFQIIKKMVNLLSIEINVEFLFCLRGAHCCRSELSARLATT